MHYLQVPFFKQNTEHTCGPASLRMTLAYYGTQVSEEELAHELQTNSEIGTTTTAMVDIAKKYGFYSHAHDKSTVDELAHLLSLGLPVVVRFVEPDEDEDHYSVVVAVSDTEVIINDPSNGERFTLAIQDFEERWRCDTTPNCNKWLLVLSKEPIAFDDQKLPA